MLKDNFDGWHDWLEFVLRQMFLSKSITNLKAEDQNKLRNAGADLIRTFSHPEREVNMGTYVLITTAMPHPHVFDQKPSGWSPSMTDLPPPVRPPRRNSQKHTGALGTP